MASYKQASRELFEMSELVVLSMTGHQLLDFDACFP